MRWAHPTAQTQVKVKILIIVMNFAIARRFSLESSGYTYVTQKIIDFLLRRDKAVLCYFPPQACGDLAERVIEATGTLSAFSHRASGAYKI